MRNWSVNFILLNLNSQTWLAAALLESPGSKDLRDQRAKNC